MTARRFGIGACAVALMLLALALVTGGAAQSRALASKPELSDVSVRLPVVPGRPGAGYFMLMGGTAADRLVSVSASPPVRVAMHETVNRDGRMKMLPLGALPVGANDHIMFERGGKHLMLYDLPATLKPGGVLPLTFRFEKAGAVTVRATLVAATATAPKADEHVH
jgi:periplasmic copper chaperone A